MPATGALRYADMNYIGPPGLSRKPLHDRGRFAGVPINFRATARGIPDRAESCITMSCMNCDHHNRALAPGEGQAGDHRERSVDLPLRYSTPESWAQAALCDPLALLNDHAHLEKKAATNALDVLCRWPTARPPENWVSALTTVARDEAEHLAIVTRLLARRGGELTREHRNSYANDLRRLVRIGEGPLELMDRLMISALIESRSCERFVMLSRHCDDPELARLYAGLWASENGHYRIFLELSRMVGKPDVVEQRWSFMLDREAEIIQAQQPGPRMHSGMAALSGCASANTLSR